ncbi:hypothetical protein HZS_5407, partial [Henneguya salminicola]
MEVQFSLEYPSSLKHRVISKEDFENAIIRINHLFFVAEKVDALTVITNIFAFLCCYLHLLCIPSFYEKQMMHLEDLICELNREIFYPKKLKIYHPIHRGLRL